MSELCGNPNPRLGAFGMRCTLQRGHNGPHVAHGMKNQELARWDDSPGPDEAQTIRRAATGKLETARELVLKAAQDLSALEGEGWAERHEEALAAYDPITALLRRIAETSEPTGVWKP